MKYLILLLMTFTLLLGCEGSSSGGSSQSNATVATYTISFETNGGLPALATEIVESGNTASAPATILTKTGYDFMGWYSDTLLAKFFNFSTPIFKDTILYAKWIKPNEKMITSFRFLKEDNSELGSNIIAKINEQTKTITFSTLYSIKNLVPAIGYQGVEISYASRVATDFSNGATYTVRAKDGSEQVYTVNASSAWTQATASAQFSARSAHTSVVFASKLWVIGGNDGQAKNDVWSSDNGITWTQATANAEFPTRWAHASVVFANKLWVIGGYDAQGNSLNDVWYTSDGMTWTQATTNAQFSARSGHTSVVFANKLWVIGGINEQWNYTNDAWYTNDGKTWTQATANAEFPKRWGQTSVVFDNKLWGIGGYGGGYKNDVWYTSDGKTWTQVENARFSTRAGHTSVAFDDKLWIIGGFAGQDMNDVWSAP